MEQEVGQMQETIQEMETSCDQLYTPCDPDPAHTPVCRNLTRKQGYLYIRNKTGLVSSSWERQYFFTQGGNLMQQRRGEVAGGLLLDLDNSSVMAVDCDDRRFCLQWIATINNISKRIYLSENAEELAARVNQSALEAVTPSPSFQQRHESMRPSRRSNPFGESGDGASEDSEDSILHQLFIVRFLGSMEVKTAESPDVIPETMRQILAARAIHNIFRMTESHLLVTCDCLKYDSYDSTSGAL
ncbi:DCC-interacting protein 13-alpha [Liparis tanakae]|uniref:DCC-interacting protein 13-alpha n=1 Tax=Liparis tanakae TaxID=230148 RepID=A0A4Z2EEM1_9TELE|nr:DCC-interacting protein 13-alpha [Liparis tanakae]